MERKVKQLLIGFIGVCLSWLASAATENEKPATIPQVLQIVEQTIQVNGKPVTVYNIIQPNGTPGLTVSKNQWLDLIIQNKTREPTTLHWHGLIVPNNIDGAPFVTQPTIEPGKEFRAKFQILQSGTFWVHAPYKSQLQNLMAAPVIVLDSRDAGLPNVIMLLQDFSYKNSKESYTELRKKLLEKIANVRIEENPTTTNIQPALHQVTMDAYLTNRHTLLNPEIVRIMPGSNIFLRVIDAAANSNFFIDLGQLNGALIAVDGETLDAPLNGSKFQIAQGQRLDFLITIPEEGDNYYPILAQAEGTTRLTGLILAAPDVTPPLFNTESSQPPQSLDYTQELQSSARYPLLPQKITKSFDVELGGNMLSYLWTINNEVWPNVKPFTIQYGDRVRIAFSNKTPITIPIHLHGHVFQVIEINGKRINGAMHDTVFILPHSTLAVAFDADNPGSWLLEAAIPYLSYGRMATLINYESYPLPIFRQKDTGIPDEP